MKEIIKELYTSKQRLEGLQNQLLTWCRDKSNLLDERFDVWVDFVDKHNYRYESKVPSTETAPRSVQDHFEDDNRDRYVVYDFWYLIDHCLEKESSEIEEWLISTNFGSYAFDW